MKLSAAAVPAFFITLFTSTLLFAQEKKTCNVAIVVHEGVELFDFAGPGEVFAAAKNTSEVLEINVFTVAPKKEAIISQTFLSINPSYSIADAPKIDILVVPGGRTGVLLRDEAFMSWVEDRFSEVDHLLTVCTGAFVPAQLGILDGLKATTHHGSINSLRSNYPGIEVIENIKFVDNGKVITSGGVSSGTEGALHMIHRISGLETARKVARYMEYDHWKPDLGLIVYENEIVKKLKAISEETSSNDQLRDFDRTLASVEAKIVDYGELENLGLELKKAGYTELSLKVFDRMRELYPSSMSIFKNMGQLYEQLGKKAPPSEEVFFALIEEKGPEKGMEVYEEWIKVFPDWKMFSENKMNYLGYRYLSSEKTEEAIQVFELNAKAYPGSWNCWDSLAEGYMRSGDQETAIKYYKKSLEMNPDNDNAHKMIEQMKSATTGQ